MKYQRVAGESPTENGLDRQLILTRFPDPKARSKREHRVSLRELAEKLPGRIAASKAELPLLKLATFGDTKTDKGSLRHNSNVLTIEGVEGDYDGGRVTTEQAAAKLRKAGLAALIYTSPSHRPEKPRWRVLCPTSRPLPPAERERLAARVMGALAGELAGESFTLSQTYYYGRIEGWPAPHVELVDGRPIDLADDLDAAALDKHGNPYGVAVEPDEDEDDLEAEPDVERIGKALDSIPVEKWDQRELWLTIGQALHHEFNGDEDGFKLWDETSQWSGKYDSADQRRVWESFGSFVGKPVTIGTLYRLAKKHGAKPESLDGLRFLSTEECALAPPRGYIVKGLLAPGDVACIFGPPGAGKSLIAPHIGYQVALGETAFGMRTKPGRVFYVAAEDPHGMQGRIAALALRQGHAPRFRFTDRVTDLYAEDGSDLDALLEAVKDQRPSLIFIDTLAMAFPGVEENDAASMGRVVNVARQLAEHGAAVVLIHHDTKAEGSTPRGHSILNGALDMALHIRRDEDGVVRGRLTKNRNGTPDRDIAFRIGTEELGTDEDGDPITAALAEELPSGMGARPLKLPHAQREALAILSELEAEGSVAEEAWRDGCVNSRRVSQVEDRDNRRRAFNTVRKKLFEKGLIAFRNGKVFHAEATSGDDE